MSAISASLVLAACLFTAISAGAQDTLTVIHQFGSPNPGDMPNSLIQASDGNFYGTTYLGFGTVFQVAPGGQFTTLFLLPSSAHTNTRFFYGDFFTSVVEGPDGNLYVTVQGSNNNPNPMLFRISKSGTGYQVVLQEAPSALSVASDGNLYGSDGNGIFRLSTSGTYTLLSSASSNGFTVDSLNKQATDGNFYGTCYGGSPLYHVCRVTTSGVVTPIVGYPTESDGYALFPANGLLTQTNHVETTLPDDFAHAEWLATGGHTWDRIAALVLSGTRTEGGVPGKFEKIIDLRTGYSRTVFETGPMRTMEGYDGVAWQAGNGIVNSVDLPPLVADARSEAFVDRAGWRSDAGQTSSRSQHKDQVDIVHYTPLGGSEVEVSYDHNSHLVTQVTIESDDGPLSITYGDWHSIGKVKIAFRQVQKDSTGEVTILEIKQARLLRRIDAAVLARPQRTPHGQLTSSDQAKRTVPFTYKGGAHILVPARINDVETNLIFDTGAANYVSPSSAQRFGLEVAGGLNLSGVGESSTTGGYAKTRKISIGAAELKDEVVVVAPTPFGGRSGDQGAPDGLPDSNFFLNFARRSTIRRKPSVSLLSTKKRTPVV